MVRANGLVRVALAAESPRVRRKVSPVAAPRCFYFGSRRLRRTQTTTYPTQNNNDNEGNDDDDANADG